MMVPKIYYALITFILFVSNVYCKVSKHALTESMGQEVIEIASRIKDLPPDLEEEPSAENFDSKATSTTLAAATLASQNLPRSNFSRSMKNDEARIEKELAELYKDTDYKADSGEMTSTIHGKVVTPTVAELQENDTYNEDKPIARSKYRFEPDDLSVGGLARFRTKVDVVDCKNKLSDELATESMDSMEPVAEESNGCRIITGFILCLLSTIVNV